MCRHNRRAFTLVELLAVMGIIAILIGILMVVLLKARDQARSIRCMVNLRTLGLGLANYVRESRHYPGLYVQAQYAVWPTRLREALGGNQEAFYCPSRPEDYDWTPGMTRPPVPENMNPTGNNSLGDPGFGFRAGERAISGFGFYTPFSYAYNGWGTDIGIRNRNGAKYRQRGLGGVLRSARYPEDRGDSSDELKASKVRAPSSMIAISDAEPFKFDPWVNCFGLFPFESPYNDTFFFRPPGAVHRGGANVLFCDGHVEWYPRDALLIRDADALINRQPLTSKRDQDVARLWNYDNRP
jgi:prepilin-type processing-associated H-X9-DG protein/prepilin-type N-terminal cleavage/methylation domain-containing protein